MNSQYKLVEGGDQLGKVFSKSTRCDLCNEDDAPAMYDAMLPSFGVRARVCPGCFDHAKCSLGIGRGQRYERTQ